MLHEDLSNDSNICFLISVEACHPMLYIAEKNDLFKFRYGFRATIRQ